MAVSVVAVIVSVSVGVLTIVAVASLDSDVDRGGSDGMFVASYVAPAIVVAVLSETVELDSTIDIGVPTVMVFVRDVAVVDVHRRLMKEWLLLLLL
jgi:hypothetical protein